MDAFDDTQAEEEGWDITSGGIGVAAYFGHFGCASDDPITRGTADALALAYVQQRAAEGSAYHIDALARTQLL